MVHQNSIETYHRMRKKLKGQRFEVLVIIERYARTYPGNMICANQISEHWRDIKGPQLIGNDNARTRAGELLVQRFIKVICTKPDPTTGMPNNYYRAVEPGETIPRALPKLVTRDDLFKMISAIMAMLDTINATNCHEDFQAQALLKMKEISQGRIYAQEMHDVTDKDMDDYERYRAERRKNRRRSRRSKPRFIVN